MYTTCPSCVRQYRIRAKQLSIAAGVVRCGYCGEQFNALVRLSDEPLLLPEIEPETIGSISGKSCGTGILALAALRLGAAETYAVDIDPQAIQVTRENAERNHLTENMIVAHPDEIELPVADVLLANILFDSLQELAHIFANQMKPQGKIVLSGILAVQAEECLSTYASWFNMEPPLFRQEWTMLQGTRL